ncbi:MAG: metallophosphoesterase family protein [Maricaulaceae bacterium]
MDIIHYVIGDIHGQAEKLGTLLDMIKARHGWKFPDKTARLIYLGDYIDRGQKSAEVIDLIMKPMNGFETVCLKGNHEAMMLDAIMSDDYSRWRNWMSAGGEPTLKSFGYDLLLEKFNTDKLIKVVGKTRLDWLSGLKLSYQYADFLCVHAGLMPDVKIKDQVEKDMLWIRRRFLESDYDFGFGIIHGHTPETRPVVKRNRIGIDTGAGMGGELTALVVDRPWLKLIKSPVFLSAYS